MYFADLFTDNRVPSNVKVTDFNPDGSVYGSPWSTPVQNGEAIVGSWKSFKGMRGFSSFSKSKTLTLNPVIISEYKLSDPQIDVLTPIHPVWGRRKIEGSLHAWFWSECGLSEYISGQQFGKPTYLSDLSLQKAFGKVESGEVSGNIIIGEMQETLHYLSNPLRTLVKHLSRPKRIKDWNNLKRAADATADMFLEINFGLKPIIDDIQSIYAALEKVRVRPSIRRASSGAPWSTTNTKVYKDRSFASFHTDVMLSGKTEVRASSQVYYNLIFEDGFYRNMDRYGLNPVLIPLTMWQVYPLSFVVDWFVGISTWIRALQPKPNTTIIGNCTTVKTVENYTMSLTPGVIHLSSMNGYPAIDYTLDFPGKMIESYSGIVRSVNSPVPTGIYPGKGIDNLGKLVSGLALTWQRLPRTYLNK